MEETNSTPMQTYNGNCHCGYFRFIITTPPIVSVTECNCSICVRKGYKWVFPPEGGFIVTHPTNHLTMDALETYTFGKGTVEHKFCSTCGTGVMAVRPVEDEDDEGRSDGQKVPRLLIAINARTLQGIDPLALQVEPYDGSSLEPSWRPEVIWHVASLNTHRYSGSCHCGNVKLMFSTPFPIDANTNKQRLTECDCSQCVRNAAILICPYRLTKEMRHTLAKYQFGRERQNEFCPTCGCHVRVSVIGKAGQKQVLINLRLFDNVKFDELKVERLSYKDTEPAYTLD